MKVLLSLFLTFFEVGAFSFGGGYAAMALIQSRVVEDHHWLSAAAFTDLVTLSQMTPGPIAINAATFAGLQVAGLAGALAATVGVILPSCLLVTFLSLLYARYRGLKIMQGLLETLRPAVLALIFGAGLTILLPVLFEGGSLGGTIRLRPALLFALALFLLRRKKGKIGPIPVMLICGILEGLAEWLSRL